LLSGFGGFKAGGGPVYQGNAYVVGEEGPELFSPGMSGRITPNSALRSGGDGGNGGTVNNITMHLHGVADADSFRKSQSQISAQMGAMLSRHMKRNG
jgi:hypothetical protein